MKTTFVTSLVCAIGSIFALVALSAMTVHPDAATMHARWMAIALALFLGSSLLALWARRRIVKATIIIALFLASSPAIRAADEFEDYIKQLAAGTPEQDAVSAMHTLNVAGMEAIPSLVAHLDDGTPAQSRLSVGDGTFIGSLPDGAITSTPPVGYFCFVILQTKIEDNWPKGFREFYILTPANVKQWLEDHNKLSLRQLQLVSREESMRRAEAELAARPSDLTTLAVAFLRKEVAKRSQSSSNELLTLAVRRSDTLHTSKPCARALFHEPASHRSAGNHSRASSDA